MDIIEYAEKICGRKLTAHEKEMALAFNIIYEKIPKDAVLVVCRDGRWRFMDRDGNFIKIGRNDFAQ